MRYYRKAITATVLLVLLILAGVLLEIAAQEQERQAAKATQTFQVDENVYKIILLVDPPIGAKQSSPEPEQEPAARLYDIPLSSELQEYTFGRCEELGLTGSPIDYETVLAIMSKESDYTADAVSRTGDYGIMQINQVNHEWMAEALGFTVPEGHEIAEAYLDPEQCIEAGTEILARLAEKYSDPHQILMAYNMGESGAQKQWAQGITTSAYSEDVLARRDAILEGR